MTELVYTPITIMADNTIYIGCSNEFFSHHDIGDGTCQCKKARNGTMFTFEGEKMPFCNECHEFVEAKQ